MLINIDGTDGSGKGTQTKLLAQHLRQAGVLVKTIAFPRHGHKAAYAVDQYLLGAYGPSNSIDAKAGSILYAVDRFDAGFAIQKWLKDDNVVIADRYPFSNLAHQGLKIKSLVGRKKFWKWNLNLEHNLFKLPKPSLIIILHVPAEISYELIAQKSQRAYLKNKKRDIHEADRTHLKKAEQVYLELAKYLPNTHLIQCAPNGILLSKEKIHEKVWEIIRKKLK